MVEKSNGRRSQVRRCAVRAATPIGGKLYWNNFLDLKVLPQLGLEPARYVSYFEQVLVVKSH
jgi:hypothetical protein